jgi:DNA-binding IclR family transcriptional regulator
MPSRVPTGFQHHEGDKQFATTLARGLELLCCFTPERPVLSNRELAGQLQLPPATISRLTYTLVSMGYLAPAEDGRYQLGSAVLSLGYPLLAQYTLRRQARPLMMELAATTGGTVSIGIRDRLSIVYIEAIRSLDKRVYPIEIGTRHSLAGTAIGRAYLLAVSADERKALINQLRVKSPDEWKHHGDRLQDNLARYAKDGCCVSVGEIYEDVQAVAVPLGRIDRGDPAAINCSFQGRPLDEAWLRAEVGPLLQSLARQLQMRW